jgi:hypothetical protein
MKQILILLLLNTLVYAQLASEDTQQITVESDDSMAKELFEGYRTLRENDDTAADKVLGEINNLPTPKRLEEIFIQAKLEKEVSKMDQLDKDMFVLKVSRYDIQRLQNIYPDIDKSKMENLKELLK